MDDSKIGRLTVHKDISPECYKILIDILSIQDVGVPFKFLADIVDDKQKMLELFDILSDSKLKFPNSSYVDKLINNINIWWYLKRKDVEDPEVLKACANRYNKKPKQCQEIFDRMDTMVKNMYQDKLN